MGNNTVETFRTAKGQYPLSMLTAYDYTAAKLIDQSGINGILVGDSLGMVMLGYESTVPVTMDEMVHHCKSVARAVENALLVCDMPFMSFQCSVEKTLLNAGRILKEGGAKAVKLEGGEEFIKEISALTRASIPVMGHLGLLPQSIYALGDYKVAGKSVECAKKLISDAQAVESAGAFALVLECVPAALAEIISKSVTIPVIGIGSGNKCDGQILVWQDMLGMTTGSTPKFVKKFADIGASMVQAFKKYDEEVKKNIFPAQSHSFSINEEIITALYGEKSK